MEKQGPEGGSDEPRYLTDAQLTQLEESCRSGMKVYGDLARKANTGTAIGIYQQIESVPVLFLAALGELRRLRAVLSGDEAQVRARHLALLEAVEIVEQVRTAALTPQSDFGRNHALECVKTQIHAAAQRKP